MTTDRPGTDSGLLAPAWAGSPAEAATTDEAYLAAMLDVEVALARTQAAAGVLPPRAAVAIADAARADRFDLVDLARRARGAANPVVALVPALTELVAPEAAAYVHRGATSQDILDSAAMLVARRVLDLVAGDLTRVARALAALAARHRDTVQAGRTLTQHAVPITFGLKAATWLGLTLDALRRVRASVLPAQLGGAAGTLAAYAEYAAADRPGEPFDATTLIAPFAAELGLAEPVLAWHTARTPVADLGATLSVVTGALGKFALDVQTLSRTEIREVAEPAAPGRGGSS